ncbi:glutathione S-transferase [Paraburkholderia sp. LEh10]|uniref:glutathione S-transferase family protein n=1 Tax=Paraburkholderia sp. LEh10 TaxID=2821353 RepID=UPI001AEABF4A|nr:glutathione S-transferase [Paraburkholderia sp. LEh10]MBP0588572.1 glutathione S-transferase [Paraburkholderia sp. LEh10]
MKLYYHPLSGHSHRARLFLSLLGIEHQLIEVDLAAAAHKSADFLKLNRFGQVPVLVDGDITISDSNAILVYLARKSGKTAWLPQTPALEAAVQRWLSVAAGEIAFGPAAARLITVFGAKYNADETIGRAHHILKLIDEELAARAFIVQPDPTIADVALYSYIARAPEGNVDLSFYPNVNAWLRRIEALPGFVEFQKTPVGLAVSN